MHFCRYNLHSLLTAFSLYNVIDLTIKCYRTSDYADLKVQMLFIEKCYDY